MIKVAIDDLRRLLSYNGETGVFTWNVNRSRLAKKGGAAGNLRSDGYKQVRIGDNLYLSHRLAWFYIHSEWPANEVDHINGNRSDNSLSNLRQATKSHNLQNQIRAHKGSASGFLGVVKASKGNKWRARIRADGVWYHLGYFSEPKEAHKAYLIAKAERHPYQTLTP